MSHSCCSHNHAPATPTERAPDPRFRRALWIALLVNAAMFIVEIAGSAHAGSVSVLADAIDFLGDAANYALSLAVLALALQWRARAALFKAACMGAFGCFVLARTAWSIHTGTVPEADVMGAIGLLALVANLGVGALLYAFRSGDSNMRAVWLCTRNDAIGNVAVMLAAVGVFGTGTGWPDWIVAALMGALALSASVSVMRQARMELRHSAV